MNGQRRFSGIWWIAGVFLLSGLLAGCAGPGLSGTSGDATWRLGENSPISGVRQIKVGIGGGRVMKEVEVGKMPDGYLVTVTWTDDLQLVRLLCLNPQAAGCQRSDFVPPTENHPGYRRQFIVVYVKEQMSDLTLKIMANEMCHAVANSQDLHPDPCHSENGGRI